MPAITLKNIPKNIYDQLKVVADRHHRSLNSEALWGLKIYLGKVSPSADAIIEEADRLRKSLHFKATSRDIGKFAKMGRA